MKCTILPFIKHDWDFFGHVLLREQIDGGGEEGKKRPVGEQIGISSIFLLFSLPD